MPEIGEVARIVKLLNKHAAGKVIKNIVAHEDTIIFKDTTAAAFKSALEGQSIVEAKQWGKYFWLVMDKSPHPLMHLGMTGWIHIKSAPSGHYRSETNTPTDWPPKFTKFILDLDNNDSCAFVDPRRLARIRLIDSPDGNLRPLPPLSENGPDPYIEPPSVEQLAALLSKRKVPIKALLLDQSVLAGIGNWVADEILFQARLYPETYTNKLSAAQIGRLHEKVVEVVRIAVDTDAESERFPKDWLMKHRWGKGRKDGNFLPSGEKVEFLKVGGRTTAYVPSLQRKNEGAADESEDLSVDEKPKAKPRGKATKRGAIPKKEQEEEVAAADVEQKPKARGGRQKKVKEEAEEEEEGWEIIEKEEDEEEEEDEKPAPRKRKAATALKKAADEAEKKLKSVVKNVKKEEAVEAQKPVDDGRRRSSRRRN